MPTDLILPLSIVMGLATCGLVAKWYVMPVLMTLSRAAALIPFLMFHFLASLGLPC